MLCTEGSYAYFTHQECKIRCKFRSVGDTISFLTDKADTSISHWRQVAAIKEFFFSSPCPKPFIHNLISKGTGASYTEAMNMHGRSEKKYPHFSSNRIFLTAGNQRGRHWGSVTRSRALPVSLPKTAAFWCPHTVSARSPMCTPKIDILQYQNLTVTASP